MLEELKDLIAQKNNKGKVEDDTSLDELDKIIRKCMDMKVWNQLHEHQREGVKFLIERLLSDRLPIQCASNKPSNHEVRSETGAILADGMGTGKVRHLHSLFSFTYHLLSTDSYWSSNDSYSM